MTAASTPTCTGISSPNSTSGCTPQPREDELAFFLSYAQPDSRILEPLCGSGRFLLPFLQRGFSIYGVDLF